MRLLGLFVGLIFLSLESFAQIDRDREDFIMPVIINCFHPQVDQAQVIEQSPYEGKLTLQYDIDTVSLKTLNLRIVEGSVNRKNIRRKKWDSRNSGYLAIKNIKFPEAFNDLPFLLEKQMQHVRIERSNEEECISIDKNFLIEIQFK